MSKTVTLRGGMVFGKETPLEVIQKIGEDGLSGGVSDVYFSPTYKCNLNCYMCHQQHMRDKAKPYLSLEQLKAAFDNVNVTTIYHVGGEPFVRRDIIKVLEYFDAKGTNQIISTNGMNITEPLAEKLAELKHLVCVQVSLNGSGDNDNVIRRSPNSFERTVKSIRILKKAGVLVWIHCVILKENIDDLANVVKLGGDLEVGMVNFIFAQVMSEEDARGTREIVKKWLGEEVNVGGYVGKISYSKEQLINSVNAAKEEAKKIGLQVNFFSRIFGERPEVYWEGTLLEQERPICQMTLMPPITPTVGPEGDLYWCPNIDKSFGNIKDSSLDEIWDSEPVRAFRMGMINDKLMPVCKHCPCGDLIEISAPKKRELTEKADWEAYLDRLTKALNDLPDFFPLLKDIAPVVFQYHITDRPELNYWHAFEKDRIRWGMGENMEDNIPKLTHATDFDTLKKVNAGEVSPIQATMAGTYSVDGDMSKLMACSPLIPLTAKAHAAASGRFLSKKRAGGGT